MAPSSTDRLGGALDAMAVGRILLGIGSLAAPRLMARGFGVPASPEVSYLTRIYGGRAVALGLSYLLAGDAERQRVQRISLGVDVSDTVTGVGHLVRRDAPARGMAMLVALTGSYAALGAARIVADRASRR